MSDRDQLLHAIATELDVIDFSLATDTQLGQLLDVLRAITTSPRQQLIATLAAQLRHIDADRLTDGDLVLLVGILGAAATT